MSTQDHAEQDQLKETLERTTLVDKAGDSPSVETKTEPLEEPKEDRETGQTSLGQTENPQPTNHEESKEASTVDSKDKPGNGDGNKNIPHQADTLDTTASAEGSSATDPSSTPQKSLVPSDGDLTKASTQVDPVNVEGTSHDEKNKEELAKILMQFDPLVQSTSEQDGAASVSVVDRSLDVDSNTGTGSLTPNLSVSAPSSPKPLQPMDSPKTSHDVQVATSERARSGSTKKRSESRPKAPISSDPSKSGDRGGGGGSASSSRQEPAKPKEAPFEFQRFMEQMRHRSATPIVRFYQSFLKEFDRKPWTVNEQTKIIHDFLD
ncbi:hypothetical protein BGX34_009509, partial [Mortierella sp. NVP85]